MKSPVVQALVNASLREQEQRELALRAVVAKHLDLSPVEEGDRSGWPVFQKWCRQREITPYPARPTSVAGFILDNSALGIEELLRVVKAISLVHETVADPTASGLVPRALNKIAPIDAPRSWPNAEKVRFKSLPYDLQRYTADREADREKKFRRAQTEAGQLRRTVSDLQEYFCLGFLPSIGEENDVQTAAA